MHTSSPQQDQDDLAYIQAAIDLAREGAGNNRGGPFGAVIVKDGKIVGRGCNQVPSTNDPTAHAEIVAIRDAATKLGVFHLTGCVLYSTCEPCPMCLAAIYWARIERLVFALTRNDAASAGFSDALIYQELSRPVEQRALESFQCGRERALSLFELWQKKVDKILY